MYYHSYRAIKKRKNATDIVQRSHVSYVTIVCSELLAHTATDWIDSAQRQITGYRREAPSQRFGQDTLAFVAVTGTAWMAGHFRAFRCVYNSGKFVRHVISYVFARMQVLKLSLGSLVWHLVSFQAWSSLFFFFSKLRYYKVTTDLQRSAVIRRCDAVTFTSECTWRSCILFTVLAEVQCFWLRFLANIVTLSSTLTKRV